MLAEVNAWAVMCHLQEWWTFVQMGEFFFLNLVKKNFNLYIFNWCNIGTSLKVEYTNDMVYIQTYN